MTPRFAWLAAVLVLAVPPTQARQDDDESPRIGHSSHGEGFDEGPRQRPWKFEDIGQTHFPITSSVEEVQEWFDQGNTLLHSFWYYEAERSFRWCLKLDPDCAMAWWGLSRATRGDRSREFLEEAVRRKESVTERERMYIEAWEKVYAPELSGAVEVLDEDGRNQREGLAKELELIVMAYPDDIEAKALFGLHALSDENRVGNEFVYREILENEPLHPGAHHYRIHNWDGPEGRYALDSCEVYGELAAPLDPKYNEKEKDFAVFGQGLLALRRGLVKFERWETVLDGETIPWRENLSDRTWRSYCEGLAHLETGDVEAAIDDLIALKKLEGDVEKEGPRSKSRYELLLLELRGLVALATDETLKGLGLLEEAADLQLERYHRSNDPPAHPRIVSTVLGEKHLDLGSPALAAKAFERTLETVRNDAFALSGLARARHALGDEEGASRAWGRLLFVWSDADPGLRWMTAAKELGLESEPIDDSPRPQRRYAQEVLANFGPQTWRPYAAPKLDALDPDLERVALEDYLGKNVVLVFFLGEECAHCVEQLVAIDGRIDDFDSRDVQVLAISGDTPEQNRNSLKMGELGFRLLSDDEFENALRFRSYDDFEEIELHSTIFIDREGFVRWARTGGDPFMDLDFLLAEIDRVNDEETQVSSVEASAPAQGGF